MRTLLQFLGFLRKEAHVPFEAIPELKQTQKIQVSYKKEPGQTEPGNSSSISPTQKAQVSL
jgi:hypothetical protein